MVIRTTLAVWAMLLVTTGDLSSQESSAQTGEAIARQIHSMDAVTRHWKFIVLHHTATAVGNVESIDAEHRQRVDANGEPWLGIGYHFLIGNGKGMPDGAVEATFRWRDQLHGAHAGVAKYNDLGIGICLVGDFQSSEPTAAQLKAVARLVHDLRNKFQMDADQILRHGDLLATACPGKRFPIQQILRTEGPASRTMKIDRFDAVGHDGTEEAINVVSAARTQSRQRDSRSGKQ